MASRPSLLVGLAGRAVTVRMKKMTRKMMRKMMRRMVRKRRIALMVRRKMEVTKKKLLLIILGRENWTLGRIMRRE